jgi:hypothetical protein
MSFGSAEFRASDEHGRPVDTASETPTQRAERIDRLQLMRIAGGERTAPATEPAAIFGEWMSASPDNRMSALAMRIAEDPSLLPQAEVEPGPGQEPRPGGLLEKIAARRRDKFHMATMRLPGQPGG